MANLLKNKQPQNRSNVERYFKLTAFLLTMSILSCNIVPSRLYLANETGKAITLTVDSNFVADDAGMQKAFNHALMARQLAPGHVTISFGKGKWAKADEGDLKTVLQQLTITDNTSGECFGLPTELPIGHGRLIPELIVKISQHGDIK